MSHYCPPMSAPPVPPAGGSATEINPLEPTSKGLGLPQATSLVLGTIIGVGVFTLPSSLASYGPISLVALLLTTVGAVALALMFASLSRRMPADGGPYAYARVAFGNLVGFSNAWLYWITTWGGNAAIATGWVLYVETFINKGQATWATIALTLAGIWAATAINLRGVRSMGTIQLWTSILKFVPLLFIATVGLFFIDTDNFAVWNLSGQGLWQAIGGAMALCLFSYIGVESASVAAAKVRDPQRNVPRATILGTLLAAGVYLLSLVAVFGIIPNAELQATTAPFATAAEAIFGVSWAGSLMALVVVISGFGALNGWTMLAGEMPYAAAADGLFPEHFAPGLAARRPGLRHRRLRDPGHRRGPALAPGGRRDHGVQHPGPDDRDHRRHPLRVLGHGPDQVADRRRAGHHPRPDGPRRRHRRGGAGLLGAVHRVLHEQRGRGPGPLPAVPVRPGCLPDRPAGVLVQPRTDDRHPARYHPRSRRAPMNLALFAAAGIALSYGLATVLRSVGAEGSPWSLCSHCPCSSSRRSRRGAGVTAVAAAVWLKIPLSRGEWIGRGRRGRARGARALGRCRLGRPPGTLAGFGFGLVGIATRPLEAPTAWRACSPPSTAGPAAGGGCAGPAAGATRR